MKDKRVRADGVFSVICGLILFSFWIIAIIYQTNLRLLTF